MFSRYKSPLTFVKRSRNYLDQPLTRLKSTCWRPRNKRDGLIGTLVLSLSPNVKTCLDLTVEDVGTRPTNDTFTSYRA